MKMKDAVKREEQKRKNKRKRQEWLRKIATVLIGYPIIFPIEKVKDFIVRKRKEYWMNHLEQLREKCLLEIVAFIQKDMAGYDGYRVYNAHCYDDIDYADAFYLRHFVGYGGHRYRRKDNKVSKLYKELYGQKFKNDFNEKDFYEQLYQSLMSYFLLNYKDIEIKEGVSGYSQKHPYFSLKIER